MTLKTAGFGSSIHESTAEAVAEAVSKATKSLGSDIKPSIAFCSATVTRDIEEVRKAFVDKLPKGTPIHGITSSSAILTSTEGVLPGAVGCLLLAGDKDDFCTSFDKEDSAKAAAALKEQMPSPKAIFMGSTIGAEEGVLALLEKEFPNVPVFGGTAADNDVVGEWKVFSADGEPSATGVSLVGIGKAVAFGGSMIGPYTPTSKTAKATKSEGRRVFEINGKPAADWVYNDWLGDDVKEQYEKGGSIVAETAQKPIGLLHEKKMPVLGSIPVVSDIIPGAHQKDYVVVECVTFASDNEGWVDFLAPIPQGSTLVVMDCGDGPSNGYASALSQAYDTAHAQMGKSVTPKAGMFIYCGGMAIAVGDKLNDGITSKGFVEQTKDLPLMGMMCFGEQACLDHTKENVHRNLSVGMVMFG